MTTLLGDNYLDIHRLGEPYGKLWNHLQATHDETEAREPMDRIKALTGIPADSD